jgi:hypothetical protein
MIKGIIIIFYYTKKGAALWTTPRGFLLGRGKACLALRALCYFFTKLCTPTLVPSVTLIK